jgi:cellobiose phosphorylase
MGAEGGEEAGEEGWVERETRWHSYYLRSGFSYDDFFEEHIVSQGQVYQYCMGTEGAARDPLQHGLPLVFGESELARQVLRYTLKSQRPDGSLPYAMAGGGLAVETASPASDLDLWLLWLASEYVLATRDAGFLEERLPNGSVRELLARAYRHLTGTIGVGRHGLLRGLNADWNDQIYFRGIAENLRDEVGRESESVMNAAMAAYIFEHYARMLRYAGDSRAAAEAASRAQQQRAAVGGQWSGKWFQRLWLGTTAGWVGGEDRMWLDGQPWAILGRCASTEQQKTLVESIDELLRKPSKIGAKQVGNPNGKPIDWPGVMPGETKNGGVYDTLDGPLIWALAGVDPAMAWEEWTKTSRANHAEVYPYTWYGIWSGPDVYNSADSDHAGQTGYDWGLIDPEARRRPNSYRGLSWTAWPVMNMHRHAWPLYSAAKLLGIGFTEEGMELAPAIPRAVYSFRSQLVGLEKSARGYEGWYAPKKAGSWTIRLKLGVDERAFKRLMVNDASQPVGPLDDGVLQFSGRSELNTALRWSLWKE